jgi:tripartite-type tricarboxylate transporter receptor subunit TctC
MLRRSLLLAGVAAGPALAQTTPNSTPNSTPAPTPASPTGAAWPQRPVRILVGFPPGGLTDVLARVLAPRLAERFGQAFVVENRTGASGIIAADAVAKATDGHTLLLAHPTALAIAPVFSKRLPFDGETAFAYISLLALQPHVLLVKADAPWRDLDALVADGRARPEAITFASSGIGSVQHLQAEQLCAAAGLRMTHVPYRGSAPTMTDLASGQVDWVIDGVGISAPLVESGRLRVLATAHARRLARYPEAPTLAERGIAGVLPGSWFGLAGPASLPEPAVRALAEAAASAMPGPEMQRALGNASAEGIGGSPEDFRGFVQGQIAGFRDLARRVSISME